MRCPLPQCCTSFSLHVLDIQNNDASLSKRYQEAGMTSPLALCLLLYVGGVFLDYDCFLTTVYI